MPPSRRATGAAALPQVEEGTAPEAPTTPQGIPATTDPEKVVGIIPMNNGQGLSTAQMQVLMSPLRANRVSNLSKGGKQFAYLEAWDVRAHLIRLFGFGGFDATSDEVEVLWHQTPSGDKKNHVVSVKARVTLHIKATDSTYSEYAVGTANLPSPGDAFDMATKTAVSDALKRCAINLGTQFGLSLYSAGARHDVVKALVNTGMEPIDLDKLPGIEGTVDPDTGRTPQEVANVSQVTPEPAGEES